MQIEFDPVKDQINRRKHGVSLAAAADMDLENAIIIEDRRFDYGEARFLAYALLRVASMFCGSRCELAWCAQLG